MNALDTMQNWMETYAGDLDQGTRQDAERMSKTLQQVHKQGKTRVENSLLVHIFNIESTATLK